MRNFSNQIQPKTIPAGDGQFIDFLVGGSRVSVLEASGELDLEMDDWGKLNLAGGYTVQTGNDRFSKVRVFNKSATIALTVKLSIGTGDGSVGISFDYLRLRATKQACRTGSIPLVGGPILYPGVATNSAYHTSFGIPIGARRRDAVVTNGDPTTRVIIYNADGTTGFAQVFPGQSRIVNNDQNISVLGYLADVVLVSVEENFYI